MSVGQKVRSWLHGKDVSARRKLNMEKGEDIEELEEDWMVSDVIESTSSSEEHGMYINLLSD